MERLLLTLNYKEVYLKSTLTRLRSAMDCENTSGSTASGRRIRSWATGRKRNCGLLFNR